MGIIEGLFSNPPLSHGCGILTDLRRYMFALPAAHLPCALGEGANSQYRNNGMEPGPG